MLLVAPRHKIEYTLGLATHDGPRKGPMRIHTRAFPQEGARHSQKGMLGASVPASRIGKTISGSGNSAHGGGVVHPARIGKMLHSRPQPPLELLARSNRF